MRLIALEVVRFGALAERRFELDGRAFALEGPNEAGKSSFHAAVETLFYGFNPASQSAHPYATWSTETGSQRTTLHLIGLVELGDGRRLQVERRLASRAELRVAPEGEELTGPWRKNVTLEELQAIPRPLFRAVYSLTANEIQEPDDSGIQELVDDLLLGDKGLVGARPVRELRAEVAAERAALWRPTRRGETEESRLAMRKKELLAAQREASDAERRRSEAIAELDEVRDRAEALRRELDALEVELEDARVLGELEALERAERELPRVDLSDLGPDALDPSELARRIERATDASAAPRARLERDALPRLERHVALVERQEHIVHLASEGAEDRHDSAEIERHEREARAASARADELVHGLLGRADVAADHVDRAPVEALAEGARAWRSDVDEARAALDARSRVWWPAIAALAVGAAVAGAALLGAVPSTVGGLGLALLVACGAWLLLRRPPELRRLDDLEDAPPELVALAEEACLAPTILASPEALLRATGALDEARELRASAAEAARAAGRARLRRDERRARWSELAAQVGHVAGDGLPPTALPKVLGEQLAEARAALEHAERDARERAEATRELQRHEAARAALVEQLEAETRALREVLPDVADPAQAWRQIGELAQERARLDGARRQLARSPRFTALEHDPRRASADADDAAPEPFWSERLQAERAARRDALRGELEAARRLEGELAERAKQLPPNDAATIASELRELEQRLDHARREHDRLALVERALVVGERRFRADHQPDILRTASAHLARITAGRYDRVEYPDPEDPTLHVRSTELGELVPVGPPLSRGVREQVHLCLRLGTLEHLDRGRETLPLVLDEALVHWDPPRRAALYEVLKPMTAERQVILLTCQPELAHEAARLLGARHVQLASGARAAVES